MGLDLCEICDGSGLLAVAEFTVDELSDLAGHWATKEKYVSYCHSCVAGAAWREAGLE